MAVATLSLDDPDGRRVDVPVGSHSEVRRALLDLQLLYPGLNFLADVSAPDRVRMSVVLAQDQGSAILWADPVVRTQGPVSSHSQISVCVSGCCRLALPAVVAPAPPCRRSASPVAALLVDARRP